MKSLLFFILLSSLSFSLFAQTPATSSSWKGTVGKYPVSLWLTQQDSLIYGEITYKRTGKPIQLRGWVQSKNNYRILEMSLQGNVTGILEIAPSKDIIKGDWYQPTSDKDLPVILHPSDEQVNKQVDTEPKSIGGTYFFQYGEKGYQGNLEVTPKGKGNIIFDIFGVTSESKGRNMAEAKGNGQLKNNQLVYRMQNPDGTVMACKFSIRFIWDIAVITNIDDSGCGFGLNASIDGIYMKIKKR